MVGLKLHARLKPFNCMRWSNIYVLLKNDTETCTPKARLDGKTFPNAEDRLPASRIAVFRDLTHALHAASHWIVHKEPRRYFILAPEQC